MKNFIKSKGFLFSVLAIACVGILVTCLLVNREQKSDFQPESMSANADSQEVPATPSPAANAGNRTNTSTPAPAATKDPMEKHPKVGDESENNVVIDFTSEGEDLKTETPDPPTTEGDTTDPSAPPTYAPEKTPIQNRLLLLHRIIRLRPAPAMETVRCMIPCLAGWCPVR